MPTKSSLPHWNYMDRSMHPTIDFTQLDRMPLSNNDPVLRALQERVNAQSERLEDLFISIELDRLDREEAQKKAPKKRIALAPEADEEEELDEATLQDLKDAGLR